MINDAFSENLCQRLETAVMATGDHLQLPVNPITFLVLTCAFDIGRCSSVCVSCLARAFHRVCCGRMGTNRIRITTTVIRCTTI